MIGTALIARLWQVPPTEPLDGSSPVPTPDVDWAGLAPLVVIVVGGLLLLTVTSLARGRLPRSFNAVWTVVTAVLASLCALPLWARVNGWDSLLGWETDWDPPGAFSTVGGAVGIDGFSVFVTVLICSAVAVTALLADGYLRREQMEGPELFVLLLLSASGGIVMAMANDLVVLFLGLETLSIAVYVLAAMHLGRIQSQEAGFKYAILGGFSSAIFLYGVALVYGATGSTNLVRIGDFLATSVPVENGLLLVGIGLLTVGFGFKVAAVPFHTWSPDVYDGSPTPVVAFMASAVKAAGFAGMVRVLVLTFPGYEADWRPLLEGLAVLSLVVGAVLAVVQSNVKRMMAYSSISHAGFILMAVLATSERGTAAVLFYLTAYTFMVAGTFGVMTLVGGRGDGRHSLDDYRGLGRRDTQLAFALTVFLLAQAGIPFTSGFFAKFNAIIAVVDAGHTWLGVVAMVSAVVAAFLYLRVIVAMYLSDGDASEATPVAAVARTPVPAGAGIAIALCLLVTLGLGMFPDLLVGPTEAGRPVLVEYQDATADPVAGSELAPTGGG